jgi:hypothetical protein
MTPQDPPSTGRFLNLCQTSHIPRSYCASAARLTFRLFVRMFGRRPTSLDSQLGRVTCAFIVILHILLQFAMLLCWKLFAIWAY